MSRTESEFGRRSKKKSLPRLGHQHIVLTKHAKRRMHSRLGIHKGDMYKVACRAWARDIRAPKEVQDYIISCNRRHAHKFSYRMYGDAVFVFAYNLHTNRGGGEYYKYEDLVLVTVFRHDKLLADKLLSLSKRSNDQRGKSNGPV